MEGGFKKTDYTMFFGDNCLLNKKNLYLCNRYDI